MLGSLFLVLSALSGFAQDGSFRDLPLANGVIDIPMFINSMLFLINAIICARLIDDERPKAKLNAEELALFRFFQSRCGVTHLQFRVILQNGSFVELPANMVVPDCDTKLYLVLEGKISCKAKYAKDLFGKNFVKRSGQFFDIKLFNLFNMPIGFDDFEFHAKTQTRCKLFAWPVAGLIAMRESKSPNLHHFWEFMIMRALAGVAILSHLKGNHTLYDSLSVPEHPSWLEGAPSRDFFAQEKPVGNWNHFKRQLSIIRASLWHIIPPRGVRHHPGIPGTNHRQGLMEQMWRAGQQDCNRPSFLANSGGSSNTSKQTTPENASVKDNPIFHFLSIRQGDDGHDIEKANTAR